MLNFCRKYVIFIVLALLFSCAMNVSQYVNPKNKTTEVDSDLEPVFLNNAQEKRQIVDSEYKLFYGEWEIKECINFTASVPNSTAEEGKESQYPDIIGTKIYFNRDKILNNDKIVCTSPIYTIGIIPVLEKEQLFLGKHSMSIKGLGIEGEYFNFVTILDENNIDFVSDEIIGNTFYVVDNNTLVLEYNACEFIMKRTSFIDGANMFENEHN